MPHDRQIPIEGTEITRTERGGEPSFGELVSRLTTQTGVLVRQEMALAKAELRETGTTLARDSARAGTGLMIAWTGTLSLTAALVVGLAQLLDNYWLAALIVGGVFVIVGSIIAKSAMAAVKLRGLSPKQTVETLRQDADWAKDQMKSLGHDLKT